MGWSKGNGGDETFQKYERLGHFWSTRCSTFCTLSPENLDADAEGTQAVGKSCIGLNWWYISGSTIHLSKS